jgi:hypothetical protein
MGVRRGSEALAFLRVRVPPDPFLYTVEGMLKAFHLDGAAGADRSGLSGGVFAVAAFREPP